jgi:hypothetical protein
LVEIPREAHEITLNIHFLREARLSGRVTIEGQPVTNRRVIASSIGPNKIMAITGTDPNGVYAIEGLSNGKYHVSVERGGARTVQVVGDTVLYIELP